MLITRALHICYDCLKKNSRSPEFVHNRRRVWRHNIGLIEEVPKKPEGRSCHICVNECKIGIGERGFCGVWLNSSDRLRYVVEKGLLAETYYDPHPTNCVATPVCSATTGRGFPQYTFTKGVERGFYNLAVFMGGCSLDCVFCQNWSHRVLASKALRVKSELDLLEEALDPRVTCVCYFGGDPVPHAPLLLQLSKRIIKEAKERGQRFKRICWETNGLANSALIKQMALVSLESGGIVKIDWKAWTPSIYEALTGVDGEKAVARLKENVKLIANIGRERSEPPLLVISVLLVPGYVTPEEVSHIAEYVASLDQNVPMVLLAFHPDYLMDDLPPTSHGHAEEAFREAKRAGIKEVYIGNEWLLGSYY
ncbi:MAG: radical SAM protein [Acidilobaceae archaeon]